MKLINTKTTTEKIWLSIRMTLVIFGVVSSLFDTTVPTETLPNPLIMLVLIPIMLLIVLGFQKFNPWAKIIWKKASWWDNPFNFNQPLQFFHLVAYIFIFSGFGFALSSWINKNSVEYAFVIVSIGLGTLIGVRISYLVFRGHNTKQRFSN